MTGKTSNSLDGGKMEDDKLQVRSWGPPPVYLPHPPRPEGHYPPPPPPGCHHPPPPHHSSSGYHEKTDELKEQIKQQCESGEKMSENQKNSLKKMASILEIQCNPIEPLGSSQPFGH